jgi:hypothetical protein
MDLDECECLAVCLERYVPSAIARLAGSYLPARIRFIPTPATEWILIKSRCRGALSRSESGALTYVGSRGGTFVVRRERGKAPLSLKIIPHAVDAESEVTWTCTDGHTFWGTYAGAGDHCYVIQAQIDPKGLGGHGRNVHGLVLDPKGLGGHGVNVHDRVDTLRIVNSLRFDSALTLFHDCQTHQVAIMHRRSDCLLIIDWCSSEKLDVLIHRQEAVFAKRYHPEWVAFGGHILSAGIDSVAGDLILDGLLPKEHAFRELYRRHDHSWETHGSFLPVDDETILWIVPATCNVRSKFESMVAPLHVFEIHLPDHGLPTVVERPMANLIVPWDLPPDAISSRAQTRPYYLSSFLPIVSSETRKVVGVAADVLTGYSGFETVLVPLL